jgi:general stress protein YciG
MSPERRNELAALGGRSTRPENRAYSRDRELASEAGRKGGSATRKAQP